jgi:hypothetical protein
VADPPTDAEREKALAQALVDLKSATEDRRRLDIRSPDLLTAIQREREAMERVQRLVERLRTNRP